jgi:AAHS family 3-hydroxyphenylpropionic acid transporter
MMFCGMPAGGGAVALIAYLTPNQNWRTLFLIGGLAPLVIAPLLMIFMRETYSGRKDSGSRLPLWIWAAIVPVYLISYVAIGYVSTFPAGASLAGMSPWLAILPAVIFFYLTAHRVALFAEGRGVASVLLWIIFLPTLLILYLILNWLPTLVAEKGFKAEASLASVWFNFASVAGALAFGALIDRFGVRWPVATAYAGLIGTLIALSQSGTLFFTLALCAAAGFFLIGANYGLYGAAASYYPEAMRGRGSGASIAWGRLGSVGGPLVGGSLLASGASADSVVYAMAPFAITAGVAVIILSVAAKPAR